MSLQPHERVDRPEDAALDALLNRHLSDELESFVGGSAKRFEQYIGPGPVPTTVSLVPPQSHGPRPAAMTPTPVTSNRIWWAVPLLAAAAAVAMVVVPAMRLMSSDPARPIVTSNNAGPPVVAEIKPQGPSIGAGGADDAQTVLASTDEDPQVQGAMWSEYRDAGRVYLDEQTVARRLVKTDYQRLQWTDPVDRTRVEITIPRQEVVLVSSPKF